jgi:type VI secretion system protein ImpJ
MAGESRVAWREGLFLRPQHFQQQDRRIDALVRARAAHLRPYPWGVAELAVNDSLASMGQFAVGRCSGVLPDGTPFAIPGDVTPPEPLTLPADVRDAVVYLTLPPDQSGAMAFALREAAKPATRYVVDELDVYDAFSAERASEPLELAELNLRYGVTREQTDGRVKLGVARIREVLNGKAVFDDRYIPPTLDVRASPKLAGMLNDIIGRAEQRVDELADRAVEATDGGAETFASFLLLQALNRWTPTLVHLRTLPAVHPERLYETFLAMAGELATLTRTDQRRPPPFPAYDHENLQVPFEAVFEHLQDSLSRVFERSAEQMRLELVGPGAYAARIDDHPAFVAGSAYLAVSARVPPDELRGRFASVVKCGSILKMREIVGSSLQAGVRLSPTPTPPSQIRTLPGYVYFELDKSSPDWRDFASAPAVGLHVAGDWPDLKLELWRVKRASR